MAPGSAVAEPEVKWGRSDAIHPFWFIRRAPTDSKPTPNMAMVWEKVTIVQATDGHQLKTYGVDLSQETTSYCVSVPVLVNSKLTSPGDEVVLEWNHTRPQNKEPKSKRETSAFQQLKDKAAKKARTS